MNIVWEIVYEGIIKGHIIWDNFWKECRRGPG